MDNFIITLIIIGLIRILVPLTILRWPLVGFILSMMADTIDFRLMPHTNPDDVLFYNQFDKIFDIYFLTIALYITRTWQDKAAKKWALYLILYRIVGVILFEITSQRVLLFIFPNLFDYFFLFYETNKMLVGKKRIFAQTYLVYIILILLLIPKLIQEFFIHINQQMPWQFITIPFLGAAGERETLLNEIIWLILYDSLLLGILLFKLHISGEKHLAYKKVKNAFQKTAEALPVTKMLF